MELVESLIDEENEKILNTMDETMGLQKNKNVLRDIIKYFRLSKKNKLNLDINYNILIRNDSSYNSYEKLIKIIVELYFKNGIIDNKDTCYLKFDKVNLNDEIKENVVIIFYEKSRVGIDEKKKFDEIFKKFDKKIVLIIEETSNEGEINALLNENIMWSMKTYPISIKEKELYVEKFMKENNLVYDSEIIKQISDNPYWKVKKELASILINCENSKENEVSKIIKKRKNQEEKSNKKSGLEELENLIGLEEAKKQIKKVINYLKVCKDRNNMPMLHMCFNGNPGTGKTTVARIIGKIFSEEKILSEKKIFNEKQRCDLIAKYVGQTAPKTQDAIEESLGGVLFIDEAYTLSSYIQDEEGNDYGAECIATLIKGMEDNRDNLCVILAGYTKEMENMLQANPGFESRIQFIINFPDYSEEELYKIFEQLCIKEKYKLDNDLKEVLIEELKKEKRKKNFSNARYVRSLFEKIKIEQANRVVEDNSCSDLIKKCDIEKVIESKYFGKNQTKRIGFVYEN